MQSGTSLASRGIARRGRNVLRLDFFAVAKFAAIANDDAILVGKAGKHFDAGVVFETELYVTLFENVLGTDREDRRVVAIARDRLERDSQSILFSRMDSRVSAYIPGISRPSRFSKSISVSMVRVCKSSESAKRETLPSIS